MHLNWGFLKFQFGNRFGEKMKITQIQVRFVLRHLKKFKLTQTLGCLQKYFWARLCVNPISNQTRIIPLYQLI